MKDIQRTICLLLLGFHSYLSYSLPFSIKPAPGTVLPTTIAQGNQTFAYYTVVNNTAKMRVGNFVKYLPTNVTQIIDDNYISNLCGAKFTLQAHNSIADNCILKLLITGAINSNDRDPTKHLFVCFPGGMTCAGTNYPLNVSVLSEPQSFVAAGTYSNNITQTDSMAISVSTNGNTWQMVNIPLPNEYSSAEINGMFCTDNLCEGVGFYTDALDNDYPAVLRSVDNGKTWTQKSIPLPSGCTQGTLNAVYCSGAYCNAVGGCADGATYAMTSVSTNFGITWSTQLLFASPMLLLFGVTCIDNSCLAVGVNENNYGIILKSSDNGQTWHKNLQVDNTQFNSVSCTQKVCIAVGVDTNSYTIIYYVSRDLQNWIPYTYTGGSLLPYAQLTSINCTSNYCVAVGETSNVASFSDNVPISMRFDLSGTAATPIVFSGTPSNDCSLNGIRCTNSICVGVGSCSSNPYIVTSTNAGQYSWSQQITNLPAGITTGAFNAVG